MLESCVNYQICGQYLYNNIIYPLYVDRTTGVVYLDDSEDITLVGTLNISNPLELPTYAYFNERYIDQLQSDGYIVTADSIYVIKNEKYIKYALNGEDVLEEGACDMNVTEDIENLNID